jgi:hypothetical protein
MESEDVQKSDEINLCNLGLTATIAVFQQALIYLLGRPWFYPAWIIQEVVSGKCKVMVYCVAMMSELWVFWEHCPWN